MNKMIAAAGVAASMVIGGIGGVALGVPTLVAAQEQSPDAPASESAPEKAKPGCGPHRGRVARHFAMDTAAGVLGMTNAELRAALADGKTVAEIAEDKGVALQRVIDALVADHKTHLDAHVAAGEITQEQADERLARFTERVTAFVNGEKPAFEGGDRPRGPRGRIAPAGAPAGESDVTPA